VVLSPFVLFTGVVQLAVTVMGAVRVTAVGHFASIAIHDLAVESSRAYVALCLLVPAGK
jgi:hypothetical protein